MIRRLNGARFSHALIVISVVVALSGAAPAGVAGRQVDADDRFALVSRVLPSEWTDLATSFPAPDADTATPGPSPTPPSLPVEELLAGEALVEALRGGGYVIYFRHAHTDQSQPDTDVQNLENCETQRNLSEQGRADARAIGAAVETLGIPIGEVLASEYCRTRETAELMFGRVTPTRDLTSRATTATEAEHAERIEALRRLLATPPAPGTNTVLVGHGFNIGDATGISIAEGEAAIFLPIAVPEDGTPAARTAPRQATTARSLARRIWT
jgi:phosphohistidine phosphatase SixA